MGNKTSTGTTADPAVNPADKVTVVVPGQPPKALGATANIYMSEDEENDKTTALGRLVGGRRKTRRSGRKGRKGHKKHHKKGRTHRKSRY